MARADDPGLPGSDMLPYDDRRLLTPAVIERWTGGLPPDDLPDATEVVRLERGRQRTLETIRQGAELTDLEFKLLRYFQKHERQTLTYQQLAHHLWGSTQRPITARMLRAQDGYASPYIRHIWVLVAQIRKKLEIDPYRPQHLATMRQVGYRWYNSPPSLHDGEDYHAREQEHVRLRAQVRYDFGVSNEDDPLPPGVVRRPELGPSHPDHAGPIEAEVTEQRSRPA